MGLWVRLFGWLEMAGFRASSVNSFMQFANQKFHPSKVRSAKCQLHRVLANLGTGIGAGNRQFGFTAITSSEQ
jgi:hypothetical protein